MTDPVRVERFGPGQSVTAARPADFILVEGRSFVSTLARMAQAARWPAMGDSASLHWSHAALVISGHGHIVEAVYASVGVRDIETYRPVEYHYVHIDASLEQRIAAVRFALSCVGRPYGRLSLPASGVAMLTRGRWFGRAWPLHNCGAVVAQALSRAGVVFARPPAAMMPADLARHYGVTP